MGLVEVAHEAYETSDANGQKHRVDLRRGPAVRLERVSDPLEREEDDTPEEANPQCEEGDDGLGDEEDEGPAEVACGHDKGIAPHVVVLGLVKDARLLGQLLCTARQEDGGA